MSASFSAPAWVERFTEAGGGFMGTRESLHLCWRFPTRPIADNVEARSLYREVIADPHRLAAVLDFLSGAIPEEVVP